MKKVAAWMQVFLALLLMPAGMAYAAPADQTQEAAVSAPVSGGSHGWAYGAYFGDISKYGYTEKEYFLSGMAGKYQLQEEPDKDGIWTTGEAQDMKPYQTRILVRRPEDEAAFNGTVILEWADMSNGYELTYSETRGFYENGFACVSVTADRSGADCLKKWDEERYGSLNIPDAGAAYDIFTQAAQAVGRNRQTGEYDPLGGLDVKRVIALGVSDAGSAVLSYANGLQPVENTFDGLMIAVCGGKARAFDDHADLIGTMVRSDLTVPVMALNSQSEALDYAAYRQPDTDVFRSWEIAGAAHSPDRQSGFLRQKTDRDGITDAREREDETYLPNDVNWLYTLDAACLRMQEWITEDKAPQTFEPIAVENHSYVLDESGNVLGGVRLPEMEVPTAVNIARPDYPKTGYTIRFSEEKLTKLYPEHEEYMAKMAEAAAGAERAGVILPYRTAEYAEMAETASVPSVLIPDTSNPLIKPLMIAALIIVLVAAFIAGLIVRRARVHKKKQEEQVK